MNKKHNIKYGKLPAKEEKSIPWDKLLVDLIGQYKIRIEVTMIDTETGWFERIQYNNKQSDTRANLLEQTWLCRYPKPTIITYNRGNEFLGHESKIDPIEN